MHVEKQSEYSMQQLTAAGMTTENSCNPAWKVLHCIVKVCRQGTLRARQGHGRAGQGMEGQHRAGQRRASWGSAPAGLLVVLGGELPKASVLALVRSATPTAAFECASSRGATAKFGGWG